MPNANDLAAFFYFRDHMNEGEESPFLDSVQISAGVSEAENFVSAVNHMLHLLMTTEYANEVDMQADIYAVGKSFYGVEKKELLLFFRRVYQIMNKANSGPRLSNLIVLLSKEEFCRIMRNNMNNPWMF